MKHLNIISWKKILSVLGSMLLLQMGVPAMGCWQCRFIANLKNCARCFSNSLHYSWTTCSPQEFFGKLHKSVNVFSSVNNKIHNKPFSDWLFHTEYTTIRVWTGYPRHKSKMIFRKYSWKHIMFTTKYHFICKTLPMKI